MGFSPRLNLLQIRQAVPKIQVIGNFGSTQDWWFVKVVCNIWTWKLRR